MAVACGEDDQLFVDWRKELQIDSPSDLVDWRKEVEVALPGEWDSLDDGIFDYLNLPEGKLPRDMTKEEVVQNWQDVMQVKVKEVKGLFDLGCFKPYPRQRPSQRHRCPFDHHVEDDRRERWRKMQAHRAWVQGHVARFGHLCRDDLSFRPAVG